MTAGELKHVAGVDVSDNLVRVRLREAGLRNRVAAQKPKLSATNKEKRLQFARDHIEWTVEDWANVVFTDESTGADLNIIENVWGILKSNLSKMSLHDASPDDLWEAVKSEWDALKDDMNLVPALFDSLPRRIAGVAQSGGEFQRY
ncbi:uncharacterized protein LOC144129498 [Amblyomma americanum]